MSKYRFIQFVTEPVWRLQFKQYGVCALWLVLALCLNSFAQTDMTLAKLYQSGKLVELQNLHQQNKIQTADWKLFVDAIFESDAESASQKMLSAYSVSKDPQLQNFIKKRVSQFYSARGYYETSRRILEDESFFQRIIAINNDRQTKNKNGSGKKTVQPIDENGKQFGIQVGAFSTVQNARNVSRKYQKYYSDTKVMKKTRNGNSLYIVVIAGYNSREDAEKAIPAINNQLNVKGYIIQY